MRTPEVFAALVALTELGMASLFIGTAVADRKRAVIVISVSTITASASIPLGLQLGTGWIPVALASAGALTLAWGWLERQLVWIVGAALALAAQGTWPLLLPVFQPMAVVALLVLLTAGGAMLGLSLRRFRQRAWFSDLSALSVLVGLALMAGPVLSTGWRRAAIAAEGQDPMPVQEPIELWPLGVAAVALAAGLGWKLITNTRGSK